ncbi:hypothetical protein PIB30_028102 [Stylosanthes scabra]|uniref:Uncharacterized protein n=1 Tax=Stylosanthes scabra TaxID=79078 RepID=A0ABU6TAL8_9FABA|nr:hypothetical protein [Stylosanthes scabra]
MLYTSHMLIQIDIASTNEIVSLDHDLIFSFLFFFLFSQLSTAIPQGGKVYNTAAKQQTKQGIPSGKQKQNGLKHSITFSYPLALAYSFFFLNTPSDFSLHTL